MTFLKYLGSFFPELYEQHWLPCLLTEQKMPDSDCLDFTYIPVCMKLILLSGEIPYLFDSLHPYS